MKRSSFSMVVSFGALVAAVGCSQSPAPADGSADQTEVAVDVANDAPGDVAPMDAAPDQAPPDAAPDAPPMEVAVDAAPADIATDGTPADTAAPDAAPDAAPADAEADVAPADATPADAAAGDAAKDIGFDITPSDGSVSTDMRSMACRALGGTVTTMLCCASASDFPNTCMVGACGCAPGSSRMVTVCQCPSGMCFDGFACLPR